MMESKYFSTNSFVPCAAGSIPSWSAPVDRLGQFFCVFRPQRTPACGLFICFIRLMLDLSL